MSKFNRKYKTKETLVSLPEYHCYLSSHLDGAAYFNTDSRSILIKSCISTTPHLQFSFETQDNFEKACEIVRTKSFPDSSSLNIASGAIKYKLIECVSLVPDHVIFFAGEDVSNAILRETVSGMTKEEQQELLTLYTESFKTDPHYAYFEGIGVIHKGSFGGIVRRDSGIFIQNKARQSALWFPIEEEGKTAEALISKIYNGLGIQAEVAGSNE